MYVDIKELKAIQAKAVAAKVGSNIIEHIIRDIKNAAAEGNDGIKIIYKNYNISSVDLPFVCHWARICGFTVAAYDIVMYINWN